MAIHPLIQADTIRARALLVGSRIDLRALEFAERLAVSPVAVSLKGGGIAVLFRYGVVVFFGVDAIEQTDLIEKLKPLITQPYLHPEVESVEIRIIPDGREGMEGNTICLQEATVERFQLVAEILGKSVVLARYESQLSQSFDRIEPLAAGLEQNRRIGRDMKALLRHIGGALASEQNMVGRVEVTDKPDLLWERPELERFYLRLEDEFEIRERHAVLERKLDLVTRTAQTILELLHNRRSLRVEWYIVILIVFEIVLSLYDMFIRTH